MRNFIIESLVDAKNQNMKTFDFQLKQDDGDVISLEGCLDKEIATFEITRTRTNGHQCSRVPVVGMPLTYELIIQIADVAVESL